MASDAPEELENRGRRSFDRLSLRSLSPFVPDRWSIAFLTASALIITQIPLLNVLGLEFSSAVAPIVSLVTGWTVVRHDLPLHRRTWIKLVIRSLLFSFPPFIVGLAAALFIRNCSLLEGIGDYLLIVPPATMVGLGLAVFARGCTARWPRTLLVLLWLAVLLPIVLSTLAGPQIFAFNLIVGFFPGFSYDESFGFPGSLEWFRVVTMWFAATALIAGVELDRKRREKRKKLHAISAMALLSSVVVLTAVWWGSDRLGWSSSLDRIERELGGRREGDRLILIYPSDVISDERADRLLAFHEFTYERIRRTLRVWPERKVVCVVYRDADQKNRLVGGGRTNFAKPWLGQVHLLRSEVVQSLRHELVHVLASDFGIPVLGIGVNAGVIEGLAVALERTTNGETVHRAAAQILAVHAKSSVEDLFTLTGFFRGNSSASYALAGSFSRYLIERFGIRSYQTFYRTGDAQRAFFHDLSALVVGWKRRIDEIPLKASDSAKAVLVYRRPPIYARECVRVIGDLNAAARSAFAAKRDLEGLEMAERSWTLTGSPEAAHLRTMGLIRTGHYSELLTFVDSLREDTTRWPFVQTLDLWAGDAWWCVESLVQAAAAYARVRDLRLASAWTEAAAFRWEALTKWGWERPLAAAVIGTDPDSVKRNVFEGAALAERGRPRNALLRYAASRLISAEEEPTSVIRLLEGLPSLGQSTLDYIGRRKLASAYLVEGSYERAKAALWESLNFTDHEADLIEVSEAIAYCDWLKSLRNQP